MRGLARYHGYVLSREGLTATLMAWQRAAQLDPRSATIQAMLGVLYYIDARFEFWTIGRTRCRGAVACGRRSRLDGGVRTPIWCEACSCSCTAPRRGGVRCPESMVLGPGSADVAAFGGFVLAMPARVRSRAGDRRAIRLCPMYPPFYLGHLGLAYRVAGRVSDAIAAFEGYDRSITGRGVTDLAIIHEQLGNMDKARAWAQKLMSAFPDFSAGAWQRPSSAAIGTPLLRIFAPCWRSASPPERSAGRFRRF